MGTLLRAINAERLKLKRSLAWRLVFIGPLVMVGLAVASFMQNPHETLLGTYGGNPWMTLGINSLGPWVVMLLSLFITLETALLGRLEDRANGWRRNYALGCPRWAIYLAKQLLAYEMLAASTVVLLLGAMLAGVILNRLDLFPGINFSAPVDWNVLLGAYGLSFVGSLLIIALHTWVGIRSNFALASVVGIVAGMAGLMVNRFDFAWFYPWATPALSALTVLGSNVINADLLPAGLALNVLGAVVLTGWGIRNIGRRDVA